MDTGLSAAACGTGRPLPVLPPGFDAADRAVLMDFIVGLSVTLQLTDYSLHLASAVIDKYLSLQEGPVGPDRIQIIGATCLKVADVFAEPSKEYYKQENATEYAEATLGATGPEQMLLCEKQAVPMLGFDLHIPTMHWFLRCYLAYGRFSPNGGVGKTACFISDMCLLDYEVLAYAPSLRAQCALALAVFVVQQGAAAQKQKPKSPTGAVAEWSALELVHLQHWDTTVRDKICRGNTAVDAAMALQALVRTLTVGRREWRAARLANVEQKHAALARSLQYPERFPVSRLVRYVIPDSQRGLIPE